MRVSALQTSTARPGLPNEAPFGVVLCVQGCFHDDTDGFNWVDFCGIDSGIFAARNFRKVEEIKLYVAAAEKAKQPSLQPV